MYFTGKLANSTEVSCLENCDSIFHFFRKMSDLSVDELRTLSNIYELSCHLIHLNGPFLIQFCESIDIIANDLMIHILANGKKFSIDVKLATLLLFVLFILSYRSPDGQLLNWYDNCNALLCTQGIARECGHC